MIKVIGIGDNVCDKYLHQNTIYPGGQALNVAVYCKLKGCNAAYIGVIGNDNVGRQVAKTLTKLGVDTSHVRFVEGENGYAVVDIVDGDRVFLKSNKGGVLREHPIELSADDLMYIDEYDVIHTSNNSYMDHNLQQLNTLRGILSYDFSKSWQENGVMDRICPWTDVCFLSCSEMSHSEIEAALFKAIALGCTVAVATMGEKGALAYDGSSFYRHMSEPVSPLDTLGAGDSFAAGFLMEYAKEQASSETNRTMLPKAMEAGGKLASETCMVSGAFGYGCPIE